MAAIANSSAEQIYIPHLSGHPMKVALAGSGAGIFKSLKPITNA